MRMDKLVRELHKEVGGEFSPFNLAKYMEIEIDTSTNLGDILGIYTAGVKQFYITSDADLDKQEDICFQLVNHCAVNKKEDLWITEANFKPLMFRERIMSRVMHFIKNNKITVYVSEKLKNFKQKSSLA